MSTTTIQVDVEVRDRLRALGRMGESYNDVLRRLLAAGPMEAPLPTPRPEPVRSASSRTWRPLQGRE